MVLDLIAVGILAVFVAFGAWRGAVATATGVVILILGYALAFWAAQAFGTPMAEALGLPAILGPPAAGSVAFAAVFVVGAIVGALLKAWDKRRLGDLPRGGGDRLIGALFGAVRGSLVVVLLAWMALWANAGRELSAGESLAAAPDTGKSAVAAATGAVVETAVEAVFQDSGPGGRVAARMAARPAETLTAVQGLVEDSRIRAVQDDKLFWTYVENGAVDSALNRGSFWRIVNDESLRTQLADLGVIDAEAAADPKAFRAAAGEVLTDLGPRIKGLSNDPEIQRLARDPEILAMLERGDTMGLIAHPGIRKVASRISSGME